MSGHHPLLRKLLFRTFLVGLTASLVPVAARADVLALDWSHLSSAYQSGAANANTQQNFTIGSNTVSTVFGYQGGASSSVFVQQTPTVATNGSGTPANIYTTGGLTDGELALQIGIALPNTTTDGIVFTINFTQAVYGVTFKLFDVDYTSGSFADQVRNILGTGASGTVLPTLTNSVDNAVGAAADNTAAGFSNSVTGTANNGQTSANGNVTVSFDNTVPLTSVSFVYGDNTDSAFGPLAPASTSLQIIGVSNIVWATSAGETVPEPGTLVTIGLGLAGTAAVSLRRRRQD